MRPEALTRSGVWGREPGRGAGSGFRRRSADAPGHGRPPSEKEPGRRRWRLLTAAGGRPVCVIYLNLISASVRCKHPVAMETGQGAPRERRLLLIYPACFARRKEGRLGASPPSAVIYFPRRSLSYSRLPRVLYAGRCIARRLFTSHSEVSTLNKYETTLYRSRCIQGARAPASAADVYTHRLPRFLASSGGVAPFFPI